MTWLGRPARHFYWKTQKTAHCTRTRQAIEGRLALDLLRETQAEGRVLTTRMLQKLWAA